MADRWSCAVGAVFLVAAACVGPATAAPSPSESPAPAPTEGTSALVVNGAGAQTLLGMPVQTSKGEDLGHVVDIVVDRHGDLLAVIVDFGGFLGVGTRKIAVDWRSLHFPVVDNMDKLVADLPRDQLRNAPVYKPNEPIVIMGAPAPSPTPSPSAVNP